MRSLIREPDIQDLVDCYLAQKIIIQGWEIRKQEILQEIRQQMLEQQIKRFEGENGELVTVTPYAVRVTLREARLRQHSQK